jgi:glycosyl hydrolase family 18 (putative chitinase)
VRLSKGGTCRTSAIGVRGGKVATKEGGAVSLFDVPLWSSAMPRWSAVTHVTVFHYIPNTDGTWNYGGNAYNINAFINTAHQNGKKVTLTLGGWLGSDGAGNFHTILRSSSLRTVSITNVIQELTRRGYDGVAIDVEGDSISVLLNDGLIQWIAELSRRMRTTNPNWLLYWEVFSSGWGNAISQRQGYVDKINVMNYNGSAANPANTMPTYANILGSNKYKLVVGCGLHRLDGTTLDRDLTYADQNRCGYSFWATTEANSADYNIIQRHLQARILGGG